MQRLEDRRRTLHPAANLPLQKVFQITREAAVSIPEIYKWVHNNNGEMFYIKNEFVRWFFCRIIPTNHRKDKGQDTNK